MSHFDWRFVNEAITEQINFGSVSLCSCINANFGNYLIYYLWNKHISEGFCANEGSFVFSIYDLGVFLAFSNAAK